MIDCFAQVSRALQRQLVEAQWKDTWDLLFKEIRWENGVRNTRRLALMRVFVAVDSMDLLCFLFFFAVKKVMKDTKGG